MSTSVTARAVPCPACGAETGQLCVDGSFTMTWGESHMARIKAHQARPVLLLDVDGVVNAWGGDPPVLSLPPETWAYHIREQGVGLRVPHGVKDRLQRLHGRFDIWWATGWGRHAPRLLAPHLGWHVREWPVVEWPRTVEASLTECTWKLETLDQAVGARPAAWVDDNIEHEAQAWAQGRSARVAPTLVVKTESHECLQDGHVDTLLRWAGSLTTGDPDA